MVQRIKNLRIKTKLFLISAFTITIFVGLAAYQMSSLLRQDALLEGIYKGGFTATSSLNNLRYGTRDIVKTGLDLIAGNLVLADARVVFNRYAHGDSLSASLAEEWSTYQHALDTTATTLNTDQRNRQAELHGVLQEKMEEFLGLVETVAAAAAAPNFSVDQINTPVIQMMIARNILDGVFNLLVHYEELKAEADYQTSKQLIQSNARISTTFVAVSFVVCLLLTIGMARLIVQPVRLLETSVKSVVAGDLSQTVHYASKDELGSLSANFNTMVDRLRSALTEAHDQSVTAEAAAREAEHARTEAEAHQRYLQESVDRMLTEMERFAGGDLTVRLDTDGNDEIGRLFNGFNRALSNINDIFRNVHTAVDYTANAAREIMSRTEALATGTREQANQTMEVAAAVEEMARTIVENAGNAAHTAEAAANSGGAAHEGGAVVAQTVSKIREIAAVVGQSAQTVQRLGASSTRIGEIIEVIDEIADQTNLLALNAAIEAARAGEQGKGFAVVADEVRKLAERTTQATRQIAGMIESIQSDTTEVVDVMGRGREAVDEGIALADQAGAALRRLVDEANGVVDMINQIAVATQEQSAAGEQISRNVEAISNVTQEASQGVSDIAGSSERMNNVTEELRTLVGRFKISDARAEGPRSLLPAAPVRAYGQP